MRAISGKTTPGSPAACTNHSETVAVGSPPEAKLSTLQRSRSKRTTFWSRGTVTVQGKDQLPAPSGTCLA